MSFSVIGHRPQQRDDNSGLPASQQRALAEEVVYVTDDEAEAKRIVGAGGFITGSGEHVVALRYIEGQPPAPDAQPSALAKSVVNPDSPMPMGAAPGDGPGVPNNSTASLDRGVVRTDPTKKELTQADVERIAEGYPHDQPLRKDRKIDPERGGAL